MLNRNTKQPGDSRRWGRLAAWVAGIVLLLALSRATWIFVQHGWNAVTFPYPLDYGEGPILDGVLRLSRFQTLYPSQLTAPPFTVSIYTPLYYLLQVPFVWLFGAAFWYGRALSLLSIGVSAACIGGIVYVISRDRLAALVSGLTLFSIPFIVQWSALNRIDSLALALSLAGLFILIWKPDKDWSWVTAALLFVAAVYTRQTYGLAAPGAAFVWLLAQRPRKALLFALIFGGTGLIVFAVLNYLTQGKFLFSVITANVNQFNWPQLSYFANQVRFSMPVLLVSGTLWLLLAHRWHTKYWLLLGTYLLGAIAIALTIVKEGAWVNYLFELSAALCIIAGALLGWAHRRPWLRTVLFGLMIWQIFLLMGLSESQYIRYETSRLEQRPGFDRLMQLVRDTRGPVIANEYVGLVPLSGRLLYIDPDPVTKLARQGDWDQQPFLDAIDQQTFGAIFIHWPTRQAHWTDEMLAHIEQRYREVDRVVDTAVFRPKAVWPATLPLPGQKTNAAFGALRLIGFDVISEDPAYSVPDTGKLIKVRLFWQTTEPLTDTYTFFVHLQLDDHLFGQADVQAEDGLYPTSAWQMGETVQTIHYLTLPSEASLSDYALYAGVYSLPSGERLPAEVDGQLTDDGRVLLGP